MNRVRRFLDDTTGGNAALPLVLLFVLNLVDELDQVLYGVVAPEIRDTFGVSESTIISVATVSGALVVMLSVPVGVLADRFPRVRLARVAALVWATMAMMTGVAGFLVVLPLLFAARFGSGIGRVMNDPVHSSLLADYYPPEQHGKVFSVHRMGNPIGLILAVGAGVMADLLGWRVAFFVAAAPTFIAVTFLARLVDPPRGATVDLAAAEAAEADGRRVGVRDAFRSLRAVPTLRRIWLAGFFLGAAVIPIASFISFFFERVYGIESAGVRSAILSLFGIGSIIGLRRGSASATASLTGGDLGGLPRGAGMALVSGAVMLVGMAASPWIGGSLLFVALVGVTTSAFPPHNVPLVLAVTPARLRAQALGYFVFFFGLGAMLVAAVASRIAEANGFRVGIGVLAVFEVLAGLAYRSAHRTAAADALDASARLASAGPDGESTSAAGGDVLLSCRGVEVAYDRVQVLFGVDIDVRRGECVALLGTNGAGKSTVLNAISGLVDPKAGTVWFDGRDITHLPATQTAELGIVVVPGGKAVFPTLSVAEHLRAAAWMLRKDMAVAQPRIDRVYTTFPRLRERIDQPAGNLSGGEQQMLALGMAFVAEPKLLVIDELSLGLAPSIVEQLLAIVREIQAGGTAIVLVEQSINVALTVADRAYFLEKGEVRFEGPTAELLHRDDIVRSVFLADAAGDERGTDPARPRRTPPAVDAPVALELQSVSKVFGGITAVNDCSFDVREGEILGLVGANGAGKTTIFDLISGFLTPTSGTLLLHGQDVTALRPDKRAWLGLGRSFQDARLVPSLTVAENLAISVERHLDLHDHLAPMLGLPDHRAMERDIAYTVEDLVELMNLGAFRDKFVRELSTGSRRVVDLAMCIAHDPSVLLLDEPAAGIAQREAEALGPLIERIQREAGCAVMVIEHDMPLLTSVSDRLVALELGHPMAIGTPDAVISDPRVVASYLGSDEATINRSAGGPNDRPPAGPSARPARRRRPRRQLVADRSAR